jgi:Zn-dependent metalloprotease
MKRATKAVSLEIFTAGGSTTGEAKRKVYDSKNTWMQRVSPMKRGEGDPATGDSAVDQAYEYAGIVRDYLSTFLNRGSVDNLGMDLVLNVHYGVDYMNAFWDGDEMTFGDGDGDVFINFTKSLDVMAHEIIHGVTQFTADLDYYSQSGALNEHFSDVFGSVIQQYANGQNAGNADWLVGNEIMGPDLFGEALRSMKAPGSAYDNSLIGHDVQPSHMKDYYTGPADNQGVHINSGIPNRAFYLVAADLGTDIAALIWYTALQNLWSTAAFNDAVDVVTHAARVLTKSGRVPEGAAQTVRLAFKDVGLPT